MPLFLLALHYWDDINFSRCMGDNEYSTILSLARLNFFLDISSAYFMIYPNIASRWMRRWIIAFKHHFYWSRLLISLKHASGQGTHVCFLVMLYHLFIPCRLWLHKVLLFLQGDSPLSHPLYHLHVRRIQIHYYKNGV